MSQTTRDLFSRHKIRCTAQRKAIYEALCRHGHHPTAEELFHAVCPQTARLSLATVYNTLEALCGSGLARKLPTDQGTCRYDADMSDHVHVLIRDDDAIRDAPAELCHRAMAELRASVVGDIERRMGVRVDRMTVQLVAHRAAAEAAAPA